MDYDGDWRERYADMIKGPHRAAALLRSGWRVFLGTGCGEPRALARAMLERAGDLVNVEIVQLFTKGDAPYARPEEHLRESFTVNSFFIGAQVREAIRSGMGNYTPMLLSEIPRLFDTGRLALDAALVQVTPPNRQGRVSLGVSVDVARAAVDNASLVIAQVNPNMPWTRGDGVIDVLDLDVLVPVDEPLIQRPSHPLNPIAERIGKNAAALVPDGATLEFGLGRVPGVGRLPLAVAPYLKEKRDLGIHTEMLTEPLLDLIEAGAVTGRRKTTDRGRVTVSFCMGTRRLYDAVDDNPLYRFRATSHVNDPQVIARQHRMTAINMALEIDLTGQVCADSSGQRFYSGIGGQVDFNRGATASPGGTSIIVMPSLSRDGRRSRIVTFLRPGSGVVVGRGSAHYVVTEFGAAYLHGKSIQERVMALISIAHPDHRARLVQEAVEAGYLPGDMAGLGERMLIPGEEYMRARLLLKNGIEINFRSIRPTDEPNMRDLLYALSQETIYYRFMSRRQRFTPGQIHDLVYIDHRRDVAVVGTVPAAQGEEIVAVGRYYLNESTNLAEVAFVIRDDWQGLGIGTFLFQHLVSIARRNGIAGFTAEVLRDNRAMQHIFNSSGLEVKTTIEDDLRSFTMLFP